MHGPTDRNCVPKRTFVKNADLLKQIHAIRNKSTQQQSYYRGFGRKHSTHTKSIFFGINPIRQVSDYKEKIPKKKKFIMQRFASVSYTHLTLPTILLV